MKTHSEKNLKLQVRLSLIILTIGGLLMAFKIYADSEPGALPLLLVSVGTVWYFATRIRMRSQN